MIKTVAELNAARAAALKKVVLRKGDEIYSKEVKFSIWVKMLSLRGYTHPAHYY